MEHFLDFLNKVIIDTNGNVYTIKQLLLSILIVIISWFLTYRTPKFLKKQKTISKLKAKHTASLINFLKVVVVLLSIVAVAKVLNIDTSKISNFIIFKTEKVTFKVYHIFVFYLIFRGTQLLLNILEILFNQLVAKNKVEKGKGQSVFQIIRYFVFTIAFTLFLESLGFSITVILASLSAFLVGLGLGIQNFFNDIVSGIVILFDRSLKVGDIVETSDHTIGRVSQINLRTSSIISRDDVIIIIPNSQFTGDQVINWSHNSFKTRFSVTVGVAYGSDVNLVKKLLIESAHEHNQIDNKPDPFVLFTNFGDSSLDFKLLFYTVKSFQAERIKSDLRFSINKKFNEHNISIPFPQRDVHIIRD